MNKKSASMGVATLFFSLLCSAQSGPGGVGTTDGKSNLKLWVRADTGTNTTTNGASVTSWTDQSGSGNSLTSVGAGAPKYATNKFNGKPGITFSGSQYLSKGTNTTLFKDTNCTIIVVRAGVSSGVLVNIGEGKYDDEYLIMNNSAFHHKSSGQFTEFTHHCLSSIPKDSALIINTVFGATKKDLKYYINGKLSSNAFTSSVSTVNDYSIANRYITVGRRELSGTSVSEGFTGIVMEVIAFNSKLNKLQLDSINTYLEKKYALNNNGCGTLNVQHTEEVECKIFPNPSSGEFQVIMPTMGLYEVAVYNIQGLLVSRIETKELINNISLNTSGVFIISVLDLNKNVILRTNKIIVH